MKRILVISGPSGVGKDTVLQEVMNKLPNLKECTSHTTRSPRPGEVNGEAYWFVSKEEFEADVKDGNFIEHCLVHDNYYGIQKEAIDNIMKDGNDVSIILDVNGFDIIKKVYPEAQGVFLNPPSMEVLRNRLSNRNSDSQETINLRIKNSKKEMARSQSLDYSLYIVNDDLNKAVDEIVSFFS